MTLSTSKSNREKTIIWIAALIGLLISGYLTYVKLFDALIYCTPGLGDCASVNSSQWSSLWGIPVAIFGFLSYLAILFLVFLGPKIALIRKYSTLLVFGISFFGFLYSLYLTALEFFVIKAFCQWCIISALCMTAIFIASIFLIRRKQDLTNNNRRIK